MTGDLVRLHWYQGSDAFGRQALAIGEKARARTPPRSSGVTETEPIDFFVYADQAALLRRARARARARTSAGEAHADIRTMFALIGPSDVTDPWVGDRHSPRADPPRLRHRRPQPVPLPAALAQRGRGRLPLRGLHASDRRDAVQRPPAGDRLMPLARRSSGPVPDDGGRASTWPTPRASRRSTSSSARKGTDALVKLIRSYAAGVTDDEAFTAAIGRGRRRLRGGLADGPRRVDAGRSYGPQPAPAGPVPPGWGGPRRPPHRRRRAGRAPRVPRPPRAAAADHRGRSPSSRSRPSPGCSSAARSPMPAPPT